MSHDSCTQFHEGESVESRTVTLGKWQDGIKLSDVGQEGKEDDNYIVHPDGADEMVE